MPLERRVQQPRTLQRQCRGTRQQPYGLQSGLRGTRRANIRLGLSTSGSDAPIRVPFDQLAKRHGTCVCTTYDEPMQTDDVRTDTLLGDAAEETQRLSTEQRTQTNHGWYSDNSTLRSDLMHRSNHSIPSTERHIDSIPSDPSTTSAGSSVTSELSSMITNVVPMPTSSELTQTHIFVTHSNRASADAVQSARMHSAPSCFRQDSFNTDEPDQLTNHGRSIHECTAPIQDINSMYSSASLRSCRQSMSGMAAPSAHARQLANRVIKHARHNKTLDERSLWCPDCKRLPVLPVTGQCGHTRCTGCTRDHGACPCGEKAPKNLHVNTLIQSLVKKILPVKQSLSDCLSDDHVQTQRGRKPAAASVPACGRSSRRQSAVRRSHRPGGRLFSQDMPPHTLMTPQARFKLAHRLVSCGRYCDAAPHFARIAASPNPLARLARTLLAQADLSRAYLPLIGDDSTDNVPDPTPEYKQYKSITVLTEVMDPRRLTRALFRAVRAQGAGAWLDARELECVLCYHSFTSPVCTPCGHTYCRTCIERSMDYRKSCALCLRSLDDFDLAATRETVFVCAALEAIDAVKPPLPPEPDVIPIFVCTVAYPATPCPLFIFDPRHWLMIRRVLESGSRKFGMVAYERDRSYSDYGTVLEVCDCVHLEDGRSILSTVGVSRFRVIDRDVRDGCDVARIQPLADITPTEELAIWELRIMAAQIKCKALLWLNSMSAKVRSEIEMAFGRLPRIDHRQQDWWDSPDGPVWLWWLVAILPLRSEIKILILSTKSLLKRMMAVSRTLDAIEQIAVSAAASSECELLSRAEDWLERSA